MSYINVYPSRINWENEPSIASPINATNLNKIDYAVYEHDQTLETWDVTKANQSDLLLSVKSIDYNTSTGVFVFTWQNGTTKTVDLNIEKIPVSFSMSPQGVITMTTDDGTTYTADVGSLIKTYTFSDSAEIDFTVTTDASGNKTITAALKDGSIVGTKLEPNYLANCQSAANSASASATAADDSAEDAEAWAVGQRDGTDVPSTDPTYHNNAKWYAEHGTGSSLAGLSDVDITSPTDGQVLTYNGTSTHWENSDPSAGGGSKVTVTTTEASLKGKNVTITQGQTTLTEVFDNSGVAVFEGVTLTGTVTITATDGVDTATRTLEIPYFGNYTLSITLFTATITATFPASNGATCTCNSETATSSPYTFNIGATGTYTATCTLDGVSKTQSFTITTDGQTETHTFEYGTINLTFDNEFRGLTLTCTDSSYTITKTAPSTGNTMVFYPNETNTWTISGTYSGVTYTTTAEVSSLSTPVSAILQTIPNGSTATPTDVVQTWLKCAAINDKNYTSLAEVLNDTDTFTALLQDSNACDYMSRSTTWAVASGLVPNMTDATHPSGVVSASSTYSEHPDYYAFDGNTSTAWWSSTGTNEYIQYQFPNAVVVNKADIGVLYFNSYTRIKNFRIEASNDGTNYTTLYTGLATNNSADYTLTVTFENTTAYTYYRLYVIDNYGTAVYSVGVFELQFYVADITTNADAMARVGKYDYCSYVLRNNNTWNTAITNSPYSSYIPASPTGQTNIIHSAASDTLYYIDGSNQTIGTTDTSGVGTVDWSNVPVGNLTIYSTVANEPTDLSSAFSKTVRITPHTTEVWVVPDETRTLYWYGYEGTSFTASSSGITVTKGTNNFTLKRTSTSNNDNYRTTNSVPVSGKTIKTIINSASLGGYSAAKIINLAKWVSGTYSDIGTLCYATAITSPVLKSSSTLPSDANIGYYLQQDGQINVAALWYE